MEVEIVPEKKRSSNEEVSIVPSAEVRSQVDSVKQCVS